MLYNVLHTLYFFLFVPVNRFKENRKILVLVKDSIYLIIFPIKVAFHWNSCIFYLLHKEDGFGSDSDLFGRKFKELKQENNVEYTDRKPFIHISLKVA